MIHSRVLIQRIVSPDGRIEAFAKSVVIASGDCAIASHQSVIVKISSGNLSSSSSTSSSASSVK
ncbi:MAG TPA: hypothetical protein V6D30_15805 [Leptolyngbyaceae cyanobacterium]